MNTLDDLRATLEGHADDALSGGSVDSGTRGRQLHDRIRRARRRRTAGGAVAAVAAVAAASTFAFLPGQQQVGPAGLPTELAGHPVPAELTATGWTYEYAESVEGSGTVSLELPASDEPRLVTWAVDGDPAGWDLGSTHHDEPVVERFDLTDWHLLAPGPEVEVTLSGGDGEAALAAYELTDERPDGLTLDGLTFRDRVGSDRLVNATAVRGTSTVLLDLVVPDAPLRLAVVCPGGAGQGSGALSAEIRWARADVPRPAAAMLTTGCTPDSFDPGAAGGVTLPPGDDLPVGEDVLVEVRLVDRSGDPVETDDDVLAAAAYQVGDAAGRLAGQRVPPLVEAHGHLWELDGTTSHRLREEPLRVQVERGLVFTYFSGNRDGRVVTSVDGQDDPTVFDGIASGRGGPLVLPRAGEVEVRVDGPVAPGTRLGVALYQRLD